MTGEIDTCLTMMSCAVNNVARDINEYFEPESILLKIFGLQKDYIILKFLDNVLLQLRLNYLLL